MYTHIQEVNVKCAMSKGLVCREGKRLGNVGLSDTLSY